jgi:hypothetical protein
LATITDTVTRVVGRGRTASDTRANLTDAATRISHVHLTATDAEFELDDVATIPTQPFIYAPAPPGWQPWNVPGSYQVLSWDSEVYMGGGLGDPPPVNSAILCAQVSGGAATLKVWILASQVTPLG